MWECSCRYAATVSTLRATLRAYQRLRQKCLEGTLHSFRVSKSFTDVPLMFLFKRCVLLWNWWVPALYRLWGQIIVPVAPTPLDFSYWGRRRPPCHSSDVTSYHNDACFIWVQFFCSYIAKYSIASECGITDGTATCPAWTCPLFHGR
jgi:hypothetical protein